MPDDHGVTELAVPQEACHYDVNIRKVSNGFVLTVGCKILVTKTWKEASEGLSLYFSDPKKARAKYCEDENKNKRR